MKTLQNPEPSSAQKCGRVANHFLFIAADYKPRPGGVAAYIDSLARGLISLGDTVTVLAVVRPHEKEAIEFLQAYEPWVIPFPLEYNKPANWLGKKFVSLLEIFQCLSPSCRRLLERTSYFHSPTDSIRKMEEILSKEKPTAIVLGDLDFRLYLVALSLQENQRAYGVIAHGREVGRLPINKINDLVIRRMMLKGATWVAANSRHTKSLLEAWRLPSDRLRLVHPPISEEAIKESAVYEPESKRDDFILLTICRLVEGKGVDIVMRALKILAARGIPFRYVIGGEGPERSSLEALADELGLRDKVHFKGLVDGERKWSLLRETDVFVMPPYADSKVWQEGFGIAFVEAAAFGVPAVGSTAGGIPDAVVDGETGILVPEGSPVSVADALILLYRRPELRKEMGRAARKRATSQFSPLVVAARFRGEISTDVRQQPQTNTPPFHSWY